MRCFLLLTVLGGSVPVPTYLNRDLMVIVSPTVLADCWGKSWILFNGSLPGKCVAETPKFILEKAPCVVPEGEAAKPD